MESRRFANRHVVRFIAAWLITITAGAPSTVAAQQIPTVSSVIAAHDATALPLAFPDMQMPAPQPAAAEPTLAAAATPSLSEQLALWQIASPSVPITRERADVVSTRSEFDRPLITDTLKRIVLDPTTYAPAAIVYSSLHLDWKSSQPMFRAGYVEAHAGYTKNGLPYDIPVDYGEGQRRNRNLALRLLGRSVANNAASAVFERMLIERAPRHRKLIRVLGWIERTAFASYFSYVLSEQHFEQWKRNEVMARQIGAK